MTIFQAHLRSALNAILKEHSLVMNIDISAIPIGISNDVHNLRQYAHIIECISFYRYDKSLFDGLPVPTLDMKTLTSLELWGVWNIYSQIYTKIPPTSADKLKNMIFTGGYLLSDIAINIDIKLHILNKGPNVLKFFPEKILIDIGPFECTDYTLSFIMSIYKKYEGCINQIKVYPPVYFKIDHIKPLDLALIICYNPIPSSGYAKNMQKETDLGDIKKLLAVGARSVDPEAILLYLHRYRLSASIKALFLKPIILSVVALPIPFEARLQMMSSMPIQRATADRLLR